MKRWLLFCIALVSAALLLGCIGNVKPTPGIFGKVISKGTRQPIANATVTLFQDGTEVASLKTNESGSFSFPNLSAGSYTLTVSVEGYWDAEFRVTLAQGKRLSVTIELYSEQEGPPTDVPITD